MNNIIAHGHTQKQAEGTNLFDDTGVKHKYYWVNTELTHIGYGMICQDLQKGLQTIWYIQLSSKNGQIVKYKPHFLSYAGLSIHGLP